jgi:hypothetical protein
MALRSCPRLRGLEKMLKHPDCRAEDVILVSQLLRRLDRVLVSIGVSRRPVS